MKGAEEVTTISGLLLHVFPFHALRAGYLASDGTTRRS